MTLAISGRLPNFGAGQTLAVDPIAFGRATKGRGLQNASASDIQKDSLRLGAAEGSAGIGASGGLGQPQAKVFNNPQVSDPIAEKFFSTSRRNVLGQHISILA